MAASVDYNIVGASPPFIFSVKDENGIERFESISGGKIYFTAPNNGKYTVSVSKAGNCVVKNEITINNCTPISPTPITPAPTGTPIGTPSIICTTPTLTLTGVTGYNVNVTVGNLESCSSLEFQYSDTEDFLFYQSVFKTCGASQTIVFPNSGAFFMRVVKTCYETKKYSNIINVIINNQTANCYTYAACLGIGNDPDYDTFRIILKNVTNENVYFLLSNGSTITVYAGSNMGQEIINVSNNCPYVISNNFNFSYCIL